MTTLEKLNDDFQKFKESKLEFQRVKFSFTLLEHWKNEFLEMRLKEEWKRGMMDAKKIIEANVDESNDEIQDYIDEAIENAASS